MFNKSVNEVMRGFNKTIAELNAIAKRESGRQAQLTSQINRFTEHRDASVEEMDAAKRIADKLSKLIE